MPKSTNPDTAASPSPYVGPRPFERTEHDKFFGRTGEIRQLGSMVVETPVVLVYAGSGAGKTSLINAGLVPELSRDFGFEALDRARVRPLSTLSGTATGNPFVDGLLSYWCDVDTMRPASLAGYLQQLEHPRGDDGFPRPRLMFVDQFEELFTEIPQQWMHRAGFFDQLGQAVGADPLLRVILAIREDFVAHLDRYRNRLPSRLQGRLRLELLSPRAAHEAVTGPLKGTGRTFATGAATRLVEDLRRAVVTDEDGQRVPYEGEYIEPVQLQLVCDALWRDLPDDVVEIQERDLRRFADVDEVLASFYDDAIASASAEAGIDELELREHLEDTFITTAGTRGTAYLADRAAGRVPEEALRVLQNRHVVRAEWRSGLHWYELTHDRLIEAVRRSNRRRLLVTATDMGTAGRGRAFVVTDGPRRITGRRRVAAPVHEAQRIGATGAAEQNESQGVALCLAGGGYRSALFAAGALLRLNDAGLLRRVDQVSSTSGAAIVAALAGMRWSELAFDAGGVATNFRELVLEPLRILAGKDLDPLSLKHSFKILTGGGNTAVATSLADDLFGEKTLQELPDRPRFVFTASSLLSGAVWRFDKRSSGNEALGWLHAPRFPIAEVVAAAAAVPPGSSPAVLKVHPEGPVDGADFGEPRDVILTDGAVFDSLATETAWRRWSTVLISDGRGDRPISHVRRDALLHIMDVVSARDSELRRLRRQQALLAYTSGLKDGAYWSIGTSLADMTIRDPLPYSEKATQALAALPERLRPLDDAVQEQLVNWGYAVSDAVLRSHRHWRMDAPNDFPYPQTGVRKEPPK